MKIKNNRKIVSVIGCGLMLSPLSLMALGVSSWETEVDQGTSFVHKRTATLAGNATVAVNLSAISGAATYEFIVTGKDTGQAAASLLNAGGGHLRFEQWNNSGNMGVTQSGVADWQFSSVSSLGLCCRSYHSRNETL